MDGLEGGSEFLEPVLSNHQALLMRENVKGRRSRRKDLEKHKIERRGEKWQEETNLLT